MNRARREGTGDPAGGPGQPTLHPLKRAALAVAGGLLVLIGIALLVLPGPGLLLVLAGLLLLSRAVPRVARYVGPVRDRAMQGAEASVASAWRIASSALVGVALVAAGIVVGLRLLSGLPFNGWSTGSSLILSGAIVFALLVWSYRRVHRPRPPD